MFFVYVSIGLALGSYFGFLITKYGYNSGINPMEDVEETSKSEIINELEGKEK